MASNSTRLRALALYKELHRLGRDYPDPLYDFHGRIRRLFERNRHLTDRDEIEKALRLGDYIRKETLALYSLRKYRHLKRMYPDPLVSPSVTSPDVVSRATQMSSESRPPTSGDTGT